VTETTNDQHTAPPADTGTPRPEGTAPPGQQTDAAETGAERAGAWSTAAGHAGSIAAPVIHASAREPLTARAQARLGRGAGRIWAKGSAFVRAEDKSLTERLGRWGALGVASFIVEQAVTQPGVGEGMGVSLGAGAVAWIGACWLYGGPHGERALAEPDDDREDGNRSEDQDEQQPGPAAEEAAPQPVPVFPVQAVADPSPLPPDQAAWITDALKANGVTGAKVLTVSHRPWGLLVELEMPRSARLLTERLTDVEANLRLPMGGLSFQVNPRDTGLVTLRARRSDPFAGLGAPHHHAPKSLTVRKPLHVGLEMDGAPFTLLLARVHVALVGGTGSGKSSALWTLIDALSACEDVVLLGIDLTGAPALTAWGDVIQELADTPEKAEALLKRLVKMGRGRGSELGERARPRLGQPLPTLESENWQPSPAGPQIVLVVDEYPALVEAGLWPYVATILKEFRKGAITLLLASQRATQKELGSSTVKAQIGIKALLSCDPQDVQLLLGPGMRAKGWAPDRLQPALGDEPYDAGIAYVYGGAHVSPIPKKFNRLTLAEVHRRAIERMAAGLPQIDAATLAHAADTQPVRLDLDALRADQDPEPETLPLEPEQARLLRAVVDWFTEHEATRAHLRTIAADLSASGVEDFADMDAAELGVQLADAGVTVLHSLRVGGAKGRVTTGVLLDTVARRLNDGADTPEP
jgi:hypothetical protein